MNKSERAAFIDIGTNSILCLIAELDSGGGYRVLEDRAEITRFGEGVDQTGQIGAEGEQRSLKTLRNYLHRCRKLGVQNITAVGTSALRDAQNGSQVRARLKERLGLDIGVISGDQEASYSFLAVQRGLALRGQELLVIDVGGGSTELIRGHESGVSHAVSMDIGSVRLTERFLRSDPATAAECQAMVAAIDRDISPLRDAWLKDDSPLTLVGIAGTFTTLAAVEKKLARYSHSEVHGSRLTITEVRRQVSLFQGRSIAERKSIPGLEPKRADVILAGAYLIERIMSLFRAGEVMVSDQGVRYGLLYERLKSYRKG
jgi:exopolyphosphatase/guanosine-5'-triphosphate,3'-diphosphate pyrophosphatase